MSASAFGGIVIPLQPASVFEFEARQSPGAQRDATIGAAITRRPRTTVASLCHENRVCALPFIAWTTTTFAIVSFTLGCRLCSRSQSCVTYVTPALLLALHPLALHPAERTVLLPLT